MLDGMDSGAVTQCKTVNADGLEQQQHPSPAGRCSELKTKIHTEVVMSLLMEIGAFHYKLQQ